MTKINETNFDALEFDYPSSIDIIADTAKKINSGEFNVYDDSQVNWEEVTMYDLVKIQRLLSLVDAPLIEDTADAIIRSIDGIYDPTDPYYKPQVWSLYHNPQNATLCERDDWDYEGAIRAFIEQLSKKKQKQEEYQRKLEQRRQESYIIPNPIGFKLDSRNPGQEEELRQAKETIKEQDKTINVLQDKIKSYEVRITELLETIDNANEKLSTNWRKLSTSEVLHLVQHSGIFNTNSTIQEWAVVLHLLTGCSVNTLRQCFNSYKLTDAAKIKVEKLYDTTLGKEKDKSKIKM